MHMGRTRLVRSTAEWRYIGAVSTVLVVQPDPLLNDAWCRTLVMRGHEVLAVSGVVAGIERAREGGIDVVVVDSYDTSGAVAELAAELDRLPDGPPVILVSSSPHAPELSVHIGAAAFVPKPCEPEDLADEVQRVVSVAVRRLFHIEDEPREPPGERMDQASDKPVP
jgi:DNA-binding NtrC family response regulator